MRKLLVLSVVVATTALIASPMANAGPKAIDHGTTMTDDSALIGFSRAAGPLVTIPNPLPPPPFLSFPSSEGIHGTTWLDYDNDGDLDLYLTNAPGFPNALLRNDGGSFTDVSVAAGVADTSGGAGAVAADIDNDGWADLLVIGTGGLGGPPILGSPHKLFKNNGNGTFSDVSAASGITGPHPAMMAAFGDIDNDGDLDLFITNPGSFAAPDPHPQFLYRNDGGMHFTDISLSAGIATSFGGSVVNFIDYDEDGLTDILVGNCNELVFPTGPPGVPVPGPWELWRNNGDMTFTDHATAAGLDVRPGFPMALTTGDYDHDGDLDFFATGLGVAFNSTFGGILAEQVLFQNNGDGTYTDVTIAAGLGGFEWGWGASFADFDNDGDEDLMQIGSMPPAFGVIGAGLASPGRLYENDGAGGFFPAGDFELENDFTSGLAIGDYNGDGFPDAVITTAPFSSPDPTPQVLLTNDGNRNNWITVKLVGTTSNRDGVGAVVRMNGKGRAFPAQTKQVHAGTSFASGNSLWLTFGLGKYKNANMTVTWPSGLVESFKFKSRDINQTVTIVEGTGKPKK